MPIIYKITSPSGANYVGSTKNTLALRKSGHIFKHRNFLNNCASTILFDEAGPEACSWTTLEECDESVRYKRERFWIESIPCVNIRLPGKTPEEIRAQELANKKEYYIKNAESIKKKVMARYYAKKAATLSSPSESDST
jgi:hypothetical protein